MLKPFNEEDEIYFGYLRKSTDDGRQALSLSSQKSEIERMFPHLKIKFLEPESISAFEPYKRPVFMWMLQQIEAGKGAGIAGWHPDRLSRNAIDAGAIIHLLDNGKLKDLKFCSYTFQNSPEGKMMLAMTMSQAKYHSDKLSVDVSRGMSKKVALGKRPTLVPPGYLNTKICERGQQDIIKDPVRFDLWKQVFRMMITGNYTPNQLMKYASEELHLTQRATKEHPERPLRLNMFYNALINPFYSGYYQWGGIMEKGTHERMITEDEHNEILRILGKPFKKRPKTNIHAFTGLIRCPCGSAVIMETKIKHQKNGNVHEYTYLRCSRSNKEAGKCVEPPITLDEFNQQIDALLKNLTISERFHHWGRKYLHQLRTEEAETQETSLEAGQKRLAYITKQLDNGFLKYTSPENINGSLFSDKEWAAFKSAMLKEKHQIEEGQKNSGQAVEQWLELAERTFNFVRYARIWFEQGDIETKRAIFAALGSNLILSGRILHLQLKKPFEFIFKGLNQAEQELKGLEPLAEGENIGRIKDLASKLPVWSG